MLHTLIFKMFNSLSQLYILPTQESKDSKYYDRYTANAPPHITYLPSTHQPHAEVFLILPSSYPYQH